MAAALPLVGEELAGYRLRAVIGRGGMSVVFQAENPRLSSIVALKVLAPELSSNDSFRARFLQESRIAAGLSHPNVIPIFDMGAESELLFIAMRYVAGADLRAVLQVRGRLAPDQALSLIRQAARALDAAHRLDLVHRDVKPANLLIERGVEDDPDHVYLADFGLTKHELSRSGLTTTGEFVGTLAYIAPEQIKGENVDGRADIYSLGCVLYEALTGRVPFLKQVDAAIIWAHVEEQPVAPSTFCADLPPAFDAVIERALAKRPEDRYATCRELVDAAEAAFRASPEVAVRPSAVNPETVLGGTSPVPSSDRTDVSRPVTPPTGAETARPRSLDPTAADRSGLPGLSDRTETSRSIPGLDGSDVNPAAPAPGPIPTAGDDGPPEASDDSHPGAGDGSPPRAATVAAWNTEPGPGPPPARPAPDDRASPPPPASPEPPASPDRVRRRRGLAAAAALVVVAAIAVAVVLLTGGSSTPSGQHIGAALAAVPDNRVNGSGTVSVVLRGDVATVKVDAHGLLNGGAPHLMHIHAGGKGVCPTASAARLHNGHLAISTGNGIKDYGQVVTTLSKFGSTTGVSPNNVNFAAAPMTGNITYQRTITLSSATARLIRLDNAVVVVHGIDYNSNGRYDDVLGLSDLDKTFPGEETAPAFCGALRPQGATVTAEAGSGAVKYTAQLGVIHESPAQQVADGLALLCHLGATPPVATAGRPFKSWASTTA